MKGPPDALMRVDLSNLTPESGLADTHGLGFPQGKAKETFLLTFYL